MENYNELIYYNQLSYCLQSNEDNIIITLLIDGNPLYDMIVCKHAEVNFDNKEEVRKFWEDSYYFSIHSQEPPSEETLFYYNFPENLMPVDPKHPMIGLHSEQTFELLVAPFLATNELNLSDEKIIELRQDISRLERNENLICLSHCCGYIDCSNVHMKIERNQIEKTVSFCSFKASSDYEFHSDVCYTFEKSQYLDCLQKLKKLNDNLKTYQDYSEFESKRFYDSLE